MTLIKNKLEAAKAQRKAALIPYITAGDPDLSTTVEIIQALSEGGADVIELGVPFSDPIADGSTLQAAAERALQQDVHLGRILEAVATVRKQKVTTPLILFSYLNPLYQYNTSSETPLLSTFQQAKSAGVDGVLMVDVPLEEAQQPVKQLKKAGLESICLCAPTTSLSRLTALDQLTHSALYYISRLGITGASQHLANDLLDRLADLQARVNHPVMVGFGVSHAEHVRQLREHVAGIVCGSALVSAIAEAPLTKKAERAYQFMQALQM